MRNFVKWLFGGREEQASAADVSLRVARAGQEHAEDGLRQSEERFRLMVEVVKDYAIFMLDPEGRVATWNEGAQRIKGYTAEEIIGEHFSRFYPREAVERGWPAEELRRATAEGRFEDEGWRVRKDGSQFWANVVITAVRDEAGTLRGFAKVTRDLTERRQAEENARRLLQEEAAHKAAEEAAQAEAALWASEQQFRQLADSMPQIVWAARPDGYLDYYNERWYEFTGFPRGQYGQASWEPILHPDDVRRCVDTYFGCIKSGKPYQIEYRFKDRRTGGYRWFLGRAVPVRDEQGKVVRWFGTCTDIDDTKMAQEALRQSEQRLAAELEERTRAEQALREANQRKTEFLAVLAHELRNPLAPLRSGLQVMRLAGDNGAEVAEARAMMERQLHHLGRLVDDLLDVSRISRGKIVLRKERIPLAAVVSSAVEACAPIVQQHADELTVALPDEPVYVDADKTRLAQALCNLVNNAVKYSDRGSRIRLTVKRQAGEALISVQDPGVGIPAEMLPRVFDMFTQVDRSLEKSQGGLGVGLTIVKRLVQLHGGSVEAHSEVHGKGSEFLIRLPVARSPVPVPAEADGVPAAEQVARHRILVVDDSRDAANSLAMLLRLMGQEVQTAHDGLEAVAVASAFRPGVIFLDIGMPKLNGYDTCRRLREEPWARDVVIVALTGWGQDEDKRRSQEAGFTRHLVKPVEPAVLEELLAEAKPATA